MNYCKICGQRCGIYEICDKCQNKVDRREIKKCHLCGEYYFANKECNCLSKEAEEDTPKPIEKIETYEIKKEQTEEGCFKKAFGGTFGAGCGCVTFIAVIIIIALLIFSTRF